MSGPDFESQDKLNHLLSEKAMDGMLNMRAMFGVINLNVIHEVTDSDGDWHWLDELQSIGLDRLGVQVVHGKSHVYAELTPAGKALLAHMDYGMRGSPLEKGARKK